MMATTTEGMVALLAFLQNLRRHAIHFELASIRPETILVSIAVPGERWEVEFHANGEVEVEVFTSDGTMFGHEKLADLIDRHAE